MHKNMPATTWQAWVHVFNFFTCLLDRGGSKMALFSHCLVLYKDQLTYIMEGNRIE